MNQKVLEEAGLTPNESKIYLALLEKGASRAGEVSRNTGIHRRTVYDSIERLIEKGLVSYIKTNNRRYYEASDPDRLLELLKEKETNVKSILPELELMKNMAKESKQTLFFRGKQGLKTVFNDQIKEGKEVLVFGDSVSSHNILNYFFPYFEKQRTKKQMPLRIIFEESARKDQHLKEIPNSQIRFIKREVKAPVSTNIYGNKVSIIMWEDTPRAILIEEPAIATSFRSYFEFMWTQAKQ